MRQETFSSLHGDFLTIAVALTAGGAALLTTSPDAWTAVTLGMFVGAAVAACAGILLYRRHRDFLAAQLAADRQLERERDKLRETPDLTGSWSYEVRGTAVEGSRSHAGVCEIKKDEVSGPRSFRIYGTRKKMWVDGGEEPVDCDLDWESDWCEFTDRGYLRLEYHIEIEDKILSGHSRLDVHGAGLKGGAPCEMRGTFSLYAHNGTVLDSRGRITFRRDE